MILHLLVRQTQARDLRGRPGWQRARVSVSFGLMRARILLCTLSLALASAGCSSSAGGGGTGGGGGGATGGAAAAGTGGVATGRGGAGNGGDVAGRGGVAGQGGGGGTVGSGGQSGGGGLGGAAGKPDGSAGGGGARKIDDGGDVVDGQNACSSSNPDPCVCGRPDANPLSARECAQEMKCRAAGGVWEPYVVFLPDGGEYGPRCQTADAAGGP